MSDGNIIKWDKWKKDERDKANAANDQAFRQLKAKKLAYGCYLKWKARLTKKPRTDVELVAELRKLMEQVSMACSKAGLEDWIEFTQQMIEDKMAQVIATGVNKRNQIVQYIPAIISQTPEGEADSIRKHNAPAAEVGTFVDEKEMREIPFIKRIAEQAGWVGFLTEGLFLMALFADGETVRVGALANWVGVTHLPTVSEYKSMLVQGRNGEPPNEKGQL